MNLNGKNDKLELIREHCRVCLLDVLSSHRQSQNINHDQNFKIKSWAISIFIATAGFSLSQRKSLEVVFYFLPMIPTILFWVLHSLNVYFVGFYNKQFKKKNYEKILSELINYSYDELIDLSESYITAKIEWHDKGNLKLKRLFKEKIPGIFKLTLSDLLLFGGMIVLWLIIVLTLPNNTI